MGNDNSRPVRSGEFIRVDYDYRVALSEILRNSVAKSEVPAHLGWNAKIDKIEATPLRVIEGVETDRTVLFKGTGNRKFWECRILYSRRDLRVMQKLSDTMGVTPVRHHQKLNLMGRDYLIRNDVQIELCRIYNLMESEVQFDFITPAIVGRPGLAMVKAESNSHIYRGHFFVRWEVTHK